MFSVCVCACVCVSLCVRLCVCVNEYYMFYAHLCHIYSSISMFDRYIQLTHICDMR